MTDTYTPDLVKRLRQRASGLVSPVDWNGIDMASEAADEIMRLRERLEIGYAFVDGVRVPCENDAYDGIACRDETIKLQDERIAKLKSDFSDVRIAMGAQANDDLALIARSEHDARLADRQYAVSLERLLREVLGHFAPEPTSNGGLCGWCRTYQMKHRDDCIVQRIEAALAKNPNGKAPDAVRQGEGNQGAPLATHIGDWAGREPVAELVAAATVARSILSCFVEGVEPDGPAAMRAYQALDCAINLAGAYRNLAPGENFPAGSDARRFVAESPEPSQTETVVLPCENAIGPKYVMSVGEKAIMQDALLRSVRIVNPAPDAAAAPDTSRSGSMTVTAGENSLGTHAFPRATGTDKEPGGWVVEPGYLRSVKRAIQSRFTENYSTDLEEIEEVLLGLESVMAHRETSQDSNGVKS